LFFDEILFRRVIILFLYIDDHSIIATNQVYIITNDSYYVSLRYILHNPLVLLNRYCFMILLCKLFVFNPFATKSDYSHLTPGACY